jgi:ankyrin repeat protein
MSTNPDASSSSSESIRMALALASMLGRHRSATAQTHQQRRTRQHSDEPATVAADTTENDAKRARSGRKDSVNPLYDLCKLVPYPSPDFIRGMAQRNRELVNKPGGKNGFPPLAAAIKRANMDAARVLLEEGADPTFVNELTGNTLIHYTALRGLIFALDMLHGALAKHFASDTDGGTNRLAQFLDRRDTPAAPEPLTAVEMLASTGKPNVVFIIAHLKKLGASINTRNARGMTPLHRAIVSENHALMSTLTRLGADVNARDAENGTPLMCVLKYVDVRRALFPLMILLDAGADTTPVHPTTGLSIVEMASHDQLKAVIKHYAAAHAVAATPAPPSSVKQESHVNVKLM